MTEKIISFWEYVKLRSLPVLSGTRAEYRPGKTEVTDGNEYARYLCFRNVATLCQERSISKLQ